VGIYTSVKLGKVAWLVGFTEEGIEQFWVDLGYNFNCKV